MSPAWFGCADRARERDDPMLGSAPYAHGWLLIEHPGAWRLDALAGSGIRQDVLRRLARAAREAHWRVLLIRRTGRRPESAERQWIAVGPGRPRRGHWEADSDLLAAADAVPALAVGAEPAGSLPQHEPIILVCTHGTRDTCCAVRGRPVAAALARRWPDAVWECSHLGGDRFAGNVVVLPDAAYYGNLDAGSAVRVVEEHVGGRLVIDRLRGLARFPPVAQVAIAEAHRRFGPLAPTAFSAGPPDQLAPHRWRVPVFASDGRSRWLATVVAEHRDPAVLTCRAVVATHATAYRVSGFDPVPATD